MRKILAIVFFAISIFCAASPAYAQKTKATIVSEISGDFPSGCNQCITAALLRGVFNDIVASYQDLAGNASFTCAGSSWVEALIVTPYSGTTTVTCTQPKWSDLANTTNVVSNVNLSLVPSYTIKGNPTNAIATTTDFTIGSLSQKVTPTSSDLVIIQDQAASGALKFATAGSLPNAAGGVTSFGGLSGNISTGTGLSCGGSSCALSISTSAASVVSNISLNNTSNFFDGPSMSQGTTGTWWATGSVTVSDTSSATIVCKLWDGTNVISSNGAFVSANQIAAISLSGYISGPAANLRISCRDLTDITGTIAASTAGVASASTISGLRIQ